MSELCVNHHCDRDQKGNLINNKSNKWSGKRRPSYIPAAGAHIVDYCWLLAATAEGLISAAKTSHQTFHCHRKKQLFLPKSLVQKAWFRQLKHRIKHSNVIVKNNYFWPRTVSSNHGKKCSVSVKAEPYIHGGSSQRGSRSPVRHFFSSQFVFCFCFQRIQNNIIFQYENTPLLINISFIINFPLPVLKSLSEPWLSTFYQQLCSVLVVLWKIFMLTKQHEV